MSARVGAAGVACVVGVVCAVDVDVACAAAAAVGAAGEAEVAAAAAGELWPLVGAVVCPETPAVQPAAKTNNPIQRFQKFPLFISFTPQFRRITNPKISHECFTRTTSIPPGRILGRMF